MANQLQVPKQKLAKPPLAIHTLGDRVLRQGSKQISGINDEVRKLAQQMLQTMYSADGVGLAAPQVGVNKRLIVVDIDPENAARPPLVLVNPLIKQFSSDLAVDQEGCLSVPSIYADVRRPERVVATYRDLNGRPVTLEATGLLARCIQHEIDHLDGVLFVDRVENQIALAPQLVEKGFAVRDVQVRA
ncbi:MAG: peptide deformylase [Aphanocapsa lilacina HA4352-LM1]|jgi:peptide deformylase|uniref:Peptide deformylase n=1 Tax=Gloeobacter morelensis MG652769 TaxID=2781736 RepID=A0ABY3PS28_9CYAN|nr:peptide deformylase [Gloeobacter morelensis]MBW4698427.1 peptide deformylase [Aphanocapsa lilacina HA4352-LM1]UFP96545.1 peptide deformylase [Gloeobacter morelensis MG652769]